MHYVANCLEVCANACKLLPAAQLHVRDDHAAKSRMRRSTRLCAFVHEIIELGGIVAVCVYTVRCAQSWYLGRRSGCLDSRDARRAETHTTRNPTATPTITLLTHA